MSNIYYQKPNGELPKERKELPPKGKNSVMSIIALILSITGILFFIGAILAFIDLCKQNGHKKTVSIVALVICAFWALAIAGSDSDTSTDQAQTTAVVETESIETIEPIESIEEEIVIPTEEETTTTPEEPTVPAESKEDFIASCQPFDYKEYARYAEEHVGDRITVTVQISQILQGGLFDNSQYYRVYTNDEYNMWMGEELFMNDFRVDDNTRLLEEDIIVIYGEFGGMTNVERALSGTTEEVPTINAFYIEIMGVEDHAAEPVTENVLAVNDAAEQNLTDNNIEPVAETTPSLEDPSPSSVDEPTPLIESTPAVEPAPQPAATMVWVDDTAKRYHKSNGCGMDNAYQVTVDEAIAMGKTPCGRCYK